MTLHLVEALEWRRLLSVSATTLSVDLQAVDSASSAVESSGVTLRNAVVADKTAIIADVKALEIKSTRASDNRLTTLLNSHDLSRHVRDAAALKSLLSGGDSMSAADVKLGNSLLVHPTNKALARQISTRAATLNSTVSARLNTVNTLLSDSAFVTDLNNIAAAVPSLASTIAADETALAPLKTQYTTALSHYQAATTALASDLTTLAGG